MITTEFDNEFDLLYDAGSKGAPSIDKYEKSLYLTIAQEEIVKSYYSGKNVDKLGFENSEKRRRALNELVKPYSQPTQTASNSGISPDSKFYAIPDVFYLLVEQVTIKGGAVLPVKPITHDEYLNTIKNPFRKPNKRKALRLDVSKEASNNLVEIISTEEVTNYYMRYVAPPKPIIITDISAGEFAGMGLTINGSTAEATCLLNSEVHRDILNRAVELAIRDFRESSLRAKVETNQRI